VNQSNARFDAKKLAHLNMTYLLELPGDTFLGLARGYFEQQPNREAALANPEYFAAVMALAQPKIKSVDELGAYTIYFFTEDYPVDEKVRAKVLGKGDPKARLAEIIEAIPSLDFLDDAAIEAGIKTLAESKGLGFGDYQAIARLAVTGTNVGPSITGIFRVLGRERVLTRLNRLAASL
jgi:glutamyl-tRNA synthetase